MTGPDIHLCTFMIACRRSDSSQRISVHRQSFYVQHPPSDTFKGFFRFADTEFKTVTLYLVRIETTNRMSGTKRNQIDKVYQGIDLIQRNSTHQTAAQCFCRRTIAPRIFTTTLVSLTGSSNHRLPLDVFHLSSGSQIFCESIYFFPKPLAESGIFHCSIYGCPGKKRAGIL